MDIKYDNAYKYNKWNPFRRKPHFTELPDRCIVTNVPDRQLCNNKISTAKYHVATFLFFNLIEQFSKPANLYFFIIGLLQMVPSISISYGKPTMYLPLLIVITISMVKDFIEDLKRHRSDREENNRQVEVLSQAGFVIKRAKDILVGDIVKIHKNEYFPCDMLLLRHSTESNFVYVETKNLDGYTNLKQRKKHPDMLFLHTISEPYLIEQHIEVFYEKPNPFLYTFNGNIKYDHKRHILDNSNILLRGCSLKINQFAIGLALYTGHDTKIMLNSSGSKPKRSGLEVKMNTYFKLTFILQFIFTFLCGLIFAILTYNYSETLTYASPNSHFALNLLFSWGTWFIVFASFVPISLLVTLELIRFFQGIIISKDVNCQSRSTGDFTSVQSSNLNEELGQVNFVLSDKTGTLTKNVMNFRYAFIGNEAYGEENDISAYELLAFPRVTNVYFTEKKLFNHIANKSHPNYKHIRYYLTLLSLCHRIIPYKNEFNASSPDELALANFAKFCSYTFVETTEDNYMVIEAYGEKIEYKLLHVFYFNSDRKRMSVLLRDPYGRIVLMCKGADSILYNRMLPSANTGATFNALQRYAAIGLRTLMLCQKYVYEDVYKEWNERYAYALTIMNENRHEKLYELQSEMEKDMVMVGITAIEDKLQDNVAETIRLLKRANISVWMLTGDKKETAISIGYSAGLIDVDSEKIILDCPAENVEALLTNVESILEVISPNRVLILAGGTLTSLPENLVNRIFALSLTCKSVICCRVSPKQKEEIVYLAKREGRVLAIGDGANDVNMINKSHVGIGLKGHEGGQAARAADYVVGYFQILRYLLFNYGREIYRRNSYTIIFNIFKNMLAIMPVVWYGAVSMFSGSYIYDNWVFQFYNTAFTLLPIILYSLTDEQLTREEAIKNPYAYIVGQKNYYFNRRVLLSNFLVCIYESSAIIILVFGSLGPEMVAPGRVFYESANGMIVLAIVVIICNIRPALFSYGLHATLLIVSFLGILSFYIVDVFIEFILDTDIKNTLFWQLSSPQYWILVTILVIQIVLCIAATEGVYAIVTRFILFNKNVRRTDGLLDKTEGQTVEMSEMKENRLEKMESEIIETNRKIYTGYAYDEDESRESS